jgi:4,5-dihydroxyphthalate decarboxylase
MTRPRLPLSIALSDNPNTRPLIDGIVSAEGIDLTATSLHPSEMFWRQLRFAEFDVSEMSMSSLLISTARSPTPWVALPVFTTREFFHTRILVRADAGIAAPADLRGKRVGVPEYQQTAAIWGRGVLENEFGVRPHDMEFFMERVAAKATAAPPASSRRRA